MIDPGEDTSTSLGGWYLVGAVPIVVLVLALMEIGHLPRVLLRSRITAGLEAIPELVYLVLAYTAWPLAFVCLVAVALVASTSRPSWSRGFRVVAPLLAAVPSAHAYGTLVRYEGFVGYLPLVGLFVGFWIFVALTTWLIRTSARPGIVWTCVYWTPMVLSLGAAITTFLLNYKFYKDEYETLHLAVLEVGTTLLGLAALHLMTRSHPWFSPRRWARVGAVVAVLLGSSLGARAAGMSDVIRPYVNTYTAAGRARGVFEPIQLDDPGPLAELWPDEDGESRLKQAFGAPELPPQFRLRDHNVLLIGVEATRYDYTSLVDPDQGMTPNLARLAAMDSLVFDQAFSPSSATLQSMGSLMTMQLPSATHLEVWMRSWHGVLGGENVTLAELFEAAGYYTFWVGHDYKRAMTSDILGFAQGFHFRKLVYDDPNDRTSARALSVDHRIASEAIRALKRAKRDPRPFFGWVFLSSPHWPYLAREPGTSESEDIERYGQELRFMDDQLGRILDELERSGELEKTIVVFLSDHGEEFLEHGGRRHKRTLYEESIHVPLVVRIPGVPGRRIEGPVSTLYFFPWLLLHDDGGLREAASEKLQNELGPMLRATGSAVVSELIGHDRMLSVLIYPDIRLHFDFRTHLYEAYDPRRDPYEHEDLMLKNPASVVPLIEKMDAYRAVRRSLQRVTWDAEKEAATKADQELNALTPDPRRPKRGKPKTREPKRSATGKSQLK